MTSQKERDDKKADNRMSLNKLICITAKLLGYTIAPSKSPHINHILSPDGRIIKFGNGAPVALNHIEVINHMNRVYGITFTIERGKPVVKYRDKAAEAAEIQARGWAIRGTKPDVIHYSKIGKWDENTAYIRDEWVKNGKA